MTDEQAIEVRTKGFVKKAKGVVLEREKWAEIIETWPLPELCRLYATKHFVCVHGASGKLGQGCRKKHKNWADLSSEDKAKMKEWVTTHNTTFTLLEN